MFDKAQAAYADGVREITITADEARWPLDNTGTLKDGLPSAFPMTLDPWEALEVWDDMENQVRHRDLTMVEQAQCVAAYRITMGGRLSTGMYSELMYASHTAEPARPVLMYADPDRRRPRPSVPAELQPPHVPHHRRMVRRHRQRHAG